MLEEQLKNEIAVKYFKKFVCTDIIRRIDFSVRCKDAVTRVSTDENYLLWAEAKQMPTDIFKMLAQLLITIKSDAWDITPPKFLGCFDSEKIAFVPYYDVQPVFLLNDFNWTQTPSNVDDKTVSTVREIINKNNVFTFYYDKDEQELKNFIAENFTGGGSLLSTFIDKNNFIFVYQKWRTAVMPYINAPWDKLKNEYSIYDRDFWLAELNIDDNGTTDISDDKTVYEDFYITFNAQEKLPYELLRKDGLGLNVSYKFGFKGGGKERYAEFWKLYKRPPKSEIWNYIVDRLDLLVPQDVRERKGAFFTPQIWVEKSQQYIADVLGENWQDEYYVWDCCAGTGNLLNGLSNEYNIFASTLDQQDVDVMKERIKNGANLLESHVFQFDFLNDEFSKLPPDLYKIISDPEKRKRLVIYINPPYKEAATTRTKTGTGTNKAEVATQNRTWQKYKDKIGAAANELFALFLIRIDKELQRCKLAQFAKLKALCAPNFAKFRNEFRAALKKSFIVPANTFDNVTGDFPIGLFIWDTNENVVFSESITDVFNADGEKIGNKTLLAVKKDNVINTWLHNYFDSGELIGYLRFVPNDFQNNSGIYITTEPKESDIRESRIAKITKTNFMQISIYLAVRHCIKADWLNDRDQFLYPNDGWKNDNEFQTNCLIYTLFLGQNRIRGIWNADGSSAQIAGEPPALHVNHWIPFSEKEVGAKSLFDSHFMKDFLDGKIKPAEKQNGGLFSTPVETRLIASLQYSDESNSVLSAGRDLWKYYHTMTDANPNASLYDIKEYFQGRNDKGKMNSSSNDPVYTKLLNELKDSLRVLGEKIKPKVYEYGFLRE